MQKWQLLERTDISPSKWFPLYKDIIKLPNGTVVDDYYTSPLPDVVMILPITVRKNIVLVKQYKHAVGEIMLEIPGGFQQEGKNLKQSALAELEEETGIRTTENNLTLLGKTSTNPTKTSNITYCYLAEDLEFNSKQKLDVTEEIEIIEVAPQEVLEMVKKGEIWSSDSVAYLGKAVLLYPDLFCV